MITKMDNPPEIKNGKLPLVANMVWGNSELHQAQRDVICRLGYPCVDFLFNQDIPSSAKIVMVQGPYGPLLPFVKKLRNYPKEKRPVFVYWFQQSIKAFIPVPFILCFGKLFSNLATYSPDDRSTLSKIHWSFPQFFGKRGRDFAFLGDIIWLYREKLLDVLGVSSKIYQELFSGLGIPSLHVERGFNERYGRNLGLKRDIALIWMGKPRNLRRQKHINWLKGELVRRGLKMLIFDGVNNDFIFGEERTILLNRSWFVANIYRHLTDELSIRFFISGANGSVVISEPSQNRLPFIPGKHYVECPVRDMPDRIEYFINHPDEWQRISSEMRNFISEDLTLEKSISILMDAGLNKIQ